jgi:hypothetical protein
MNNEETDLNIGSSSYINPVSIVIRAKVIPFVRITGGCLFKPVLKRKLGRLLLAVPSKVRCEFARSRFPVHEIVILTMFHLLITITSNKSR